MDDYERQAEQLSPRTIAGNEPVLDSELAEDGAQERNQARLEMEQGLVAQEIELEVGTNAGIVEQADLGRPNDDGANVVVAGEGQGSAHQGMGADASGVGIVSPGIGTDEDETDAGRSDAPPIAGGTELVGDERVFEGDGGHPLSEQGADEHAVEADMPESVDTGS